MGEYRKQALVSIVTVLGNQTSAAQYLGYRVPSIVSKMMNDARPITDKTARRWEKILGLPPQWMDEDINDAQRAQDLLTAMHLVNVMDTTTDKVVNKDHTYGLGDTFRRLRKSQGLTQADIAKRIGISRTSVVNIESGRQTITQEILHAFATAIDCTVSIHFTPKGLELPQQSIELVESIRPVTIKETRLQEVARSVHSAVVSANNSPSIQIQFIVGAMKIALDEVGVTQEDIK
jgi:transcriptional regulator with XRE-family HTH domain